MKSQIQKGKNVFSASNSGVRTFNLKINIRRASFLAAWQPFKIMPQTAAEGNLAWRRRGLVLLTVVQGDLVTSLEDHMTALRVPIHLRDSDRIRKSPRHFSPL